MYKKKRPHSAAPYSWNEGVFLFLLKGKDRCLIARKIVRERSLSLAGGDVFCLVDFVELFSSSAEFFPAAVKKKLVAAAARRSQAVLFPLHRSEIDDKEKIFPISPETGEAHDTLLRVVGIHPLEAAGLIVQLVESRIFPIDFVEGVHVALHSQMLRLG